MEASQSERMGELMKKAYAEMILNAAKESAGRVAASEEKARRYERELSGAKDEALRLLLRLKRMISAKEIEAEMATLSHQSRIDELEAQLQEAEGVIVDLRAELDWTWDRLQKVKKSRLMPSNENIGRDEHVLEQKCAPEAESIAPSSFGSQFQAPIFDKNAAFLDQKVGDNKWYNIEQLVEVIGLSSFDNQSSSFLERASRMLESKEHLENGFMEKDCALDGSMLADYLTPVEAVDAQSFMTNDLIVKSSHKIEEKCNIPSLNAQNVERMKKLQRKSRKLVKVHTLNQRRFLFGKPTTKYLSHLTKPYQRPSILSRCRMYSVNDRLLAALMNTETKSNEKQSEGTENLRYESLRVKEKPLYLNGCSLEKKMAVHDAKAQPNRENEDAVSTFFVTHDDQQSKVCESLPCFSHCTCSLSISNKVKSGEALSKLTENGVNLRPLRPGKTLIKGVGVPLSGSKNVYGNVKAVNLHGIFGGGVKKEAESEHGFMELGQKVSLHLADLPFQSKDDYGKANVLVEQVKEHGMAAVSVPLEVSDFGGQRASDEPFQSPNQVGGNLKYTFQRKRKKEPLTVLDPNSNPQRMKAKTKSVEDLGESLVPQKSSMLNKLCRDNRHIAQVARQLIPLSAKRRCQK